jgi:fluoride exporter
MPSRALLALAAIGAVIGSGARYVVALLMPSSDSAHIPYATLTVNIVGALVIGICASLASVMQSETRRTFIVTGVLGGFTTFSAFAVESVQLASHPLQAVIYVVFTFIGAVAATHIGTRVVRTS